LMSNCCRGQAPVAFDIYNTVHELPASKAGLNPPKQGALGSNPRRPLFIAHLPEDSRFRKLFGLLPYCPLPTSFRAACSLV
jgi:hypothetical protein